ncbi:hypothetical protein [Mycoplasma sp. P36-A1]|uniref:hypothetical protein n=1 Tax=Mycoplasma sp. P36-A1 TaxID=3252900 RepID=UPI003C2F7DCC
MNNIYDDLIYEVVNPMYEVIVDNKASFSADDVYHLQKILETYVNNLETTTDLNTIEKDQSIINYTKETIEKINDLNTKLIRHGFILKEDKENIIVFFNNIAAEFGLSYNEDDITKQYRTF